MAIVQDGYWLVTYTFVDNDNNKGYTGVYLDGADTFADAYTNATAIGAAMQALSNGVLAGIAMSRSAYEDALDFTTMSEASDVERKGVFSFAGANPADRTRLEVPSINNTFVVEGSNIIDVNNATVQAFVAAVVTTNAAVTIHGVDLTRQLNTPHKIHRGSSKG